MLIKPDFGHFDAFYIHGMRCDPAGTHNAPRWWKEVPGCTGSARAGGLSPKPGNNFSTLTPQGTSPIQKRCRDDKGLETMRVAGRTAAGDEDNPTGF